MRQFTLTTGIFDTETFQPPQKQYYCFVNRTKMLALRPFQKYEHRARRCQPEEKRGAMG